MATAIKKRGAKSAAIRAAKEKLGSKATAAEIVAECQKQGVKVIPGLVYNVLAKKKGKKKGRNSKVAGGTVGNGYVALNEAVVFVKKVGSMADAKAALLALDKVATMMEKCLKLLRVPTKKPRQLAGRFLFRASET